MDGDMFGAGNESTNNFVGRVGGCLCHAYMVQHYTVQYSVGLERNLVVDEVSSQFKKCNVLVVTFACCCRQQRQTLFSLSDPMPYALQNGHTNCRKRDELMNERMKKKGGTMDSCQKRHKHLQRLEYCRTA